MKLLEHDAKVFFRKYGIPTPLGRVFTDSISVESFVEELGKPVVLKPQLFVGGRGKAGGILYAKTPKEALNSAKQLLGKKLMDLDIRIVLVEEYIEILRELYIGIALDRTNRCFVVLASSEGGIEIEERATFTPEKIKKYLINPINGFRSYHANLVAKELGYSGNKLNQLSNIILKLYQMAMDMDAELTEINPLAEIHEGFIAVDARLNIDSNALFRHKELEEKFMEGYQGGLTPKELGARKMGLNYVELDGDIGVIGNGAGLTMATIDTVMLQGGKAGNFLDLGGGATKELIKAALQFVLSDPRISVLFINVLGGMTKADDTAQAIIEAQRDNGVKPIVVRLMGTNEEEGKRLLVEAGINAYDSMLAAAKEAVRLSKEAKNG